MAELRTIILLLFPSHHGSDTATAHADLCIASLLLFSLDVRKIQSP